MSKQSRSLLASQAYDQLEVDTKRKERGQIVSDFLCVGEMSKAQCSLLL